MSRKPHFNLPGIPQHIIQRGNNREPCFYSKKDYQRYLDDLKQSAQKYHCRIHAYVLMKNHVHLLVTPLEEKGVSNMMQALRRRYVKYINDTYGRTEPLWEGRFKSCLIDSEIYLLTCMCYIELNPVRANVVEHPAEYIWSSYQHNAQLAYDDMVCPHPVYKQLGETDEERLFVYRELFQRYMDDDTIHKMRDVLNHELVLGQSYFKDKIKALTDRQTRLGKPGRRRVEEESAGYYVLA